MSRNMNDKLRSGAMLVEDGATTPESLVIKTEPSLAGWSFIAGTSAFQLGTQIEAAGWTFFYMAGEIICRGFGFDSQSRSNRALAQAIAAVKAQGCNCLEVTKVSRGSFLGLPYTSVTAHARHMQKGVSFHDISSLSAKTRSPSGKWLYGRWPPAPTRVAAVGRAVQSWENEGGFSPEAGRLHAAPALPVATSL